MKVLHFDCFNGISGDMALGALADVGADTARISQALESLGVGVKVRFEKVRKGGFAATRALVEAPPEHKHRHLHHIEKIVAAGDLTPAQKDLANRIFLKLAQAEAKAHGISIEKVHFHEVGALDSIADIVGAAVGLDLLGAKEFSSRSVPTGHGMIQCDHGMMPVPTPGTAAMLEGVPLAQVDIAKELTTPTGAAILTTVVTQWRETPDMVVEKVGAGAGTMDFPDRPNILRLFLGEKLQPSIEYSDRVWVLETNLDDVSPEQVAYCFESLFQAGALDVYSIPVTMKKGRPGLIFGVISPEALVSSLEEILFKETATLGIRRYPAQRSKMSRESIIVQTRFGPICAKKGNYQGGVQVITPEFEDCARLARELKIPLREVYAEVLRAASS
ncbi:MAG: nickel pincer cofactor biosynthesis protein LarC [Gemmataceae bacterium]|nr:nickel pincer cofactor biosynthesis protein LarC [Gemmataceae bacterium]